MSKVEMNRLAGIVEAILFTMGEAIEVEKIAKAIEHDEKTTWKILGVLKEQYEKEDRGIQLVELDTAVQLCTKPEAYDYLIRLARQSRRHVLTEVLLETLSIIAYKQPVTKQEIEKIRGVKSDHAVNKLVEYELVAEMGRLDAPGKPILFGTTQEFLRRFGLPSAKELPDPGPEQMAELTEEAEEEVQMRLNV